MGSGGRPADAGPRIQHSRGPSGEIRGHYLTLAPFAAVRPSESQSRNVLRLAKKSCRNGRCLAPPASPSPDQHYTAPGSARASHSSAGFSCHACTRRTHAYCSSPARAGKGHLRSLNRPSPFTLTLRCFAARKASKGPPRRTCFEARFARTSA